MGKFAFPIIVILTVVILVGTFVVSNRGKSETKDPDVISNAGIHWHPELKVYIKGEEQKLPGNVGFVGNTMGEIHTHSGDLPKIHYEMSKVPVTKDRVTLGSFFKAWGKEFNSTQLFDNQNGPNGNVKMTVNGAQNNDFDNYQVKDGDKIEVRFE